MKRASWRSTDPTIVHAVPCYYPEGNGGIERYVQSVCKHLRRRGYTVYVTHPDPEAERSSCYVHDGVEVFSYPASTCRANNGSTASALLMEYLRSRNADVLHLHAIVPGLGLEEIAAARSMGVRTVFTNHIPDLGFVCMRGTMTRWGTSQCDGAIRPFICTSCVAQSCGIPRSLCWPVYPIAELLRGNARIPSDRLTYLCSLPGQIRQNKFRLQSLLESLDYYVVLNEWSREVLARNVHGGPKVLINRLGVDDGFCSAKGSPSVKPTQLPLRLGYVGRFDEAKGVFDLARALRQLPRDLAFRFEFRGPHTSPICKQVSSSLQTLLGHDSRVSFPGGVSPQDVPEVLKAYDLLFCPSRTAEGGPTVALEAMAVGTPVVGASIGTLPEIIRDGIDGVLVPVGEPRGLAATIKAAVANPVNTVDKWRRELPTVRLMKDVAEDYVRLYRHLLNETEVTVCGPTPDRSASRV